MCKGLWAAVKLCGVLWRWEEVREKGQKKLFTRALSFLSPPLNIEYIMHILKLPVYFSYI